MEKFDKPQKPKEFLETRNIMLSYVTALAALALVAVYSYGIRAVIIILISVLTATVCKKICEEISKSDYPHRDLSGLATGLMVALLLPASVPYYIPFFTAVFAVVVCTVPFGTAKNSPFVPALASYCFAALCFGDKVFSYPSLSGGILNIEKTGTSLTSLLYSGTSIKLNTATVLEIITGQFPSALGTGFVIMLLGALVFLALRHPKNVIPSVAFLLGASLFALIFPRVSTGALTSLTMELCGGVILFAAVFFMSYPSVIPSRILPSIVWGLLSGIVCMAFRYFGKTEDSAVFGLLIMNAAAGFFDELPLTKREKKKIDENTPYEETTDASGVVPEEILNKIPDIDLEEILAQKDFTEENKEENVSAEDLHTAFTPENEIEETDIPFGSGGDGNE
ncbi:MAG: RnfABCDGE type electron transport complex subunit D [Oscillospiraceae bacterium]|nr:RnfABCDGE type electron transport complex subunit D [Oscillospiraceae bacterium]